ncbi:hypothetical protein DUI87_20105 [Hirundo rustica rustica]|uniref:Uncharacterized protein n=1 Tax=Hirundo rustica rustica TaxID=333673 RepID=A0A3M0JPG3_HIRRU|nr:hypothetical protein DUI87_20105 [Hirundo rustica rustica]
MVKGLEEKTYEEYLRSLCLFKWRRLRPELTAVLQFPNMEEGQALSSALCDQGQDPREWPELHQERVRVDIRGWWGTEQAPQGMVIATKAARAPGAFGQYSHLISSHLISSHLISSHLISSSHHLMDAHGGIVGVSVQGQELNWMMLVCAFQHRTLYSSDTVNSL